MEANQPNSKEEILKKHITATGIKMGETELSMRQSILDTEKSNPEFFDSILSAMTEYRSIGEREAAIGFATWMEDGNFYRSVENGIRYYHKTREEKYTKEQLYEIYKQSL